MENMDSTVIATSLAAIAHDIGTEPIALKLALTAYLVALAIFIPISSWMADRFGARHVFRWAMIVFILGSICCAISNSLLTFVLSRFLQGMGGAMMTPVARLVLVRVTPRNQLVDAMAWLSIPGLIGPIVGPPIGGAITTYLSWHWIFLINVPIGLIGVLLVNRFLPEWQRNAPRKLDFVGFVLAGTTFAGWVFGISVLTLPALPASFGYGALIIGVITAALYFWHFKRTEHPLLDLRLFHFPLFRQTVIAGAFFRFGVGATPFLFPLMLQLAFGFTPFESGMVTFAGAVGAFIAKFVAERILQTTGFRATLVWSTLITALGIFAQANLRARDADPADACGAGRHRVLPVDVLDGNQCLRVCRYRGQGCRSGQCDQPGGGAVVAGLWRGAGRRGARRRAPAGRWRRPDACRFPSGVLGCRGGDAGIDGHVPAGAQDGGTAYFGAWQINDFGRLALRRSGMPNTLFIGKASAA